MKLIYFIEDVSIAFGSIVLAVVVSAVILPLELVGAIKLTQDYEQKGRVDE
jgi:hypothetical protein